MIEWFHRQARDLPWRKTTDPYAIWISEIMLQQTQVKTVIPYWERWMKKFPTVKALADADKSQVLKLWEGLGYYSRARNLQKAARQLVEFGGREFPRKRDQLLSLPGIGPYTAGAISSIAFNQPSPILDGNVIRVLSRLFALKGDPKLPKNNRRLWQISKSLVESASLLTGEGRPCSDFNQGLMELGALVCLPRQPFCQACPLSGSCQAYALGQTETLPEIPRRPSPRQRHFLALVCQRGDRFLVRQRPADGINASYYEFPAWELPDENALTSLSRKLSLPVESWTLLCRLKHSITNSRITLNAFHWKVNGVSPGIPGKWQTRGQLDRLPFTSAHRKIVKRL